MSNVYGRALKVSIFGESHSAAVGVSISGFPAGFRVNFEEIKTLLHRRAPSKNSFSTKRAETDSYKILSGILADVTTGSPISVIFENKDAKGVDYDKELPRPSHADFVAFKKYFKCNDHSGGGHFSGRLTAPLTFAGGLCLQLLQKKNIVVAAQITNIGGVQRKQGDKEFLTADMQRIISETATLQNSLGGIIQCEISGVKDFVGSPFFSSLESEIAALCFSVPAVKGVEFGIGFEFAALKGSEANDDIISLDGKICTATNNTGGINGGISNGMPIVFSVVLRPTPSISLPQQTVNLVTGKPQTLHIKGRHDVCIVPRAVPVIEAVAAIAIADAYLFEGKL